MLCTQCTGSQFKAVLCMTCPVMSFNVSYNVESCEDVTSCDLTFHKVTSCHVTSRYVTSRSVGSHRVASRHVASRHATSLLIASRHVTPSHIKVTPSQITYCHIISSHHRNYKKITYTNNIINKPSAFRSNYCRRSHVRRPSTFPLSHSASASRPTTS